MASQLRRTLHLSVLYSTIIAFCPIGCKNPAEERDKNIIRESERINAELKKIDTLLNPSDALYDSLMSKASDHSPTRQMYYHVNDFLNGYSYDLKSRFETFVSEKGMDSLELSAVFFKEKRNDPEGFFNYLHDAAIRLKSFTKDTAKLDEIDYLIRSTPVKKAKTLFTTAPPVALLQ